jgi:hypothetical protein
MFGPDVGERAAPPKGREAAAVRRYVQETIEVIDYLRQPLKRMEPAAACTRIGAVALLEALTLFADAMQHNASWPGLELPEPDLIAAARGRAVAPGLWKALDLWLKTVAQPAHREHWCQRAFERGTPALEPAYDVLVDHAEAAMLLLFDAGRLNGAGIELALRLRDRPLDLGLLEKVRELKPRDFF